MPIFTARAADENRKMLLFIIMLQFCIKMGRFRLRLFVIWIIRIDVAYFKKFQIIRLSVYVMCNHLQSVQQQCLSHTVQIRTERVQKHHASLLRICLQMRIIFAPCKRIIHNLHETVRCHELGSQRPYTFRIGFGSGIYRNSYPFRNLYIIITVYSQHILYHIALPVHVYPVSRDLDNSSVCGFAYELHIQIR